MKKKSFLILVFLSTLHFSCTNDSSSDLIDNDIQQISYTNTVKSIIDNNCISCHGSIPSNGASIPLTTYQNVKDAILNQELLDRISRSQGDPSMMPSGGTRLPQPIIDQISAWASEGFNE